MSIMYEGHMASDGMNISYPPVHINNIPPAFIQLGAEFPRALIYLLIPLEALYFSIYFQVKGHRRIYTALSVLSVVTFWLSAWIAPISCGPAKCLQNFAVAIGTMKVLDIWARRNDLPKYTAGPQPDDWLFAFIVLTELRYESFTPNHIRVPRNQENFNEPLQLALHVGAFALLQSMPQMFPTVLAFEVLLSIYILWTSLQLLLRYKTSPALFGPLYLADSLTGFWSETWHNAFASPCTSLAYLPVRQTLPKYGVPVVVARSLGVLASFALMAIFHIYALAPILPPTGVQRVGWFFFLNGVATVSEAMVWGHKKHWLKSALAWTFEIVIASWTAEAARIPNGLSKIPWRDMCDAPHY